MSHPPVWLYAFAFALAVFRLTRLAAADRAPLGWLRRRLVVEGAKQKNRPAVDVVVVNATGRRIERADIAPWWAELAVCSWCLSLWAAAVWVVLVWAWPGAMWWPTVSLAASTVAGLLAERTGG